jgi:hypothetical protein
VKLEAPGKVSLFVYDNHTFIVHNFRDEPVNAQVSLAAGVTSISDLLSNETIRTSERSETPRLGPPTAPSTAAAFTLAPHSFRAFRIGT